jgi:hypothetical protein
MYAVVCSSCGDTDITIWDTLEPAIKEWEKLVCELTKSIGEHDSMSKTHYKAYFYCEGSYQVEIFKMERNEAGALANEILVERATHLTK